MPRMVDYEFTECKVPKLKEIKEAAAAQQQEHLLSSRNVDFKRFKWFKF